MSSKGLIHVYCGDGKGKTTAALGLALRAAGAGMHVNIVQLLKGRPTAELASLALLPNITVVRGNPSGKFSFVMNAQEREQALALHNNLLGQALDAAQAGNFQLLIIDELMGALSAKLVDEALVKKLILEKPQALEIAVTGRNPPEWLLDAADYVSEVCMRKHPYTKGIPARRGIEM